MIRNNKGAATIIVALALTGFLGITALVTDIGLYYLEQSKISNAVDAAALAGAQLLYEDASSARSVATEYFERNGFNVEDVAITIDENNNIIEVIGTGEVQYVFARVLGLDRGTVWAEARAMAGPVSSVEGGLRPLAVRDMDLEYGKSYALKVGSGDGDMGNYGAIALGKGGSSVYEYNLKYGYEGSIVTGQYVDTEPGNMTGPTLKGITFLLDQCNHTPACTFDSFKEGCARIIIVPIADFSQVEGKSEVKVLGFAKFFIEDVEDLGGETQITGRFIQHSASGDVDSSQKDYGLRGVKLTR